MPGIFNKNKPVFGEEKKNETKVIPMKKNTAAEDSTTEETLEEEVQADSQVSFQVEHPTCETPVPT